MNGTEWLKTYKERRQKITELHKQLKEINNEIKKLNKELMEGKISRC